MGAAVLGEDRVVEVFHTEAEASNADRANGVDLRFGQCPGLTFEGNFPCCRPGHGLDNPLDKAAQMSGADIGGRAATEVDELEIPSNRARQAAVELNFARHGIEVRFDLRRVFVGVHPEIAELASLATEWNVDVEPHLWGRIRFGRAAEGVENNLTVFGTPERVRRVVGYENRSHLCFR